MFHVVGFGNTVFEMGVCNNGQKYLSNSKPTGKNI